MGNFCASCQSSCSANSHMGGADLQAQSIPQSPVNPPQPASPPPPPPQNLKEEFQEIINADIVEASQLSQLIDYMDRVLSEIKSKSDQSSASTSTSKIRAPGGVKSIDLKFTSKIMDKVSFEVEKFFGKDKGNWMPREEMKRVATDLLKAAGGLHWIALGFSVLASVLERMNKVSSNNKESIKLLERMTSLARRLTDLSNRIPEEAENINRGVHTIVEGAIACWSCIFKGNAYGWVVAGTMETTLADIRRDIDVVYQDVNYILSHRTVKELGRRSVPDPKKLLEIEPLGIDDQVEAVKQLLDVDGNTPDLAVIIYGFGGAGKTTLGQAVVQTLDLSAYKFSMVTMDAQSNICELQNKIIYDLVRENTVIRSNDLGRNELGDVLKKHSTFIFIDNVVNYEDIQKLLPKNLSERNQKLRILVTSRQSSVKRGLNVSCVKEHPINDLSDEISKKILRKTIFPSQEITSHEIQGKIDQIAVACGGIPLLLEVYGRYLRNNTDPAEYEAALGSVKNGVKRCDFIEEDLSEILLYVYEKLDEDTKEAFLDICALFHAWKRDLVSSLVGRKQLERLEEAALAKTNTSERVIVHDVLKAMGVKKAEDTRLKAPKDLERVLKNDNKLKNVKGIWLHQNESVFTLQSQKIDAMEDSLRVLRLGGRINVSGQCHGTFSKLRFLHIGDIHHFPFRDPTTLDSLIALHDESLGAMDWTELPVSLKHIKLSSLEDDMFAIPPPIIRWRNTKDLKDLQKFCFQGFQGIASFPEQFVLSTSLKELDLTGCEDLVSLPKGFGRLTNLKELRLDGCTSLAVLPEKFGNLSSLELLSMSRCKNLTKLPEKFGQLSSLEHLDLKGCLNLKVLPPEFGQLSSLEYLDLNDCLNLKELPPDLERIATSLKNICIEGCQSLERLPEGFAKLSLLQDLDLGFLDSLIELPANFGTHMSSLTRLFFYDCYSLTSLPCSFGNLMSLEELSIGNCPKLSVLPTEIVQLTSLKVMTMEFCRSIRTLPEEFGHLPLQRLEMINCDSLVTLPEGFGQLQYLEDLQLRNCVKLERLSIEGLSSLRVLDLSGSKLLEGETMTTVVKLESLYHVKIRGCDKLIEHWAQMRIEKEYPIIVSADNSRAESAILAAVEARLLMDGQCRLVDCNGQLIKSSSFIDVGAAVVFLNFIPNSSISEEKMKKFLVKLRNKLPPANTHIISFDSIRSYEETSQNPAIKENLPGIKCHAIHFSDVKSRGLLTSLFGSKMFLRWRSQEHRVIVLDVVNKECRKCFVKREKFWSNFGGKSEQENIEEDIAEASSSFSQSSSSPDCNTIGQFTRLLKMNGIGHLMTKTGAEVAVDDLAGKLDAVFICELHSFRLLSLLKMYTDLRVDYPDFQMVWMPNYIGSSGSYERARACMPWLTLPYPTLLPIASHESDCIILSEEEAMIEGEDVELVLRWGADAYPFTKAKMEELKRKELSDMQQQSSLEFILGGRSCLDCSGNMVNKESLEGKVILLYAGCTDTELEPKLSCAYGKLKEMKSENFEIIYVGCNKPEHYNIQNKACHMAERMPWLRLSFSDMGTFWYRHDRVRARNKHQVRAPKWARIDSLLSPLYYGRHRRSAWVLMLLDGDGEVVTGRGKEVVELVSKSKGDDDEEEETRRQVIEGIHSGKFSEMMKVQFKDEIIYPRHPAHL